MHVLALDSAAHRFAPGARNTGPAGPGTPWDRLARERADLLTRLSAAAAGGAAPERMAEALVAAALQLTSARGAALLLPHATTPHLEVVAAAGGVGPAVGSLLPLEGSLPGDAVRTASDRIVTHPGEALGRFGTGPAAEEIHTALLVPFEFGGRTHGVLVAFDLEDPACPVESSSVRQLAALAALSRSLDMVGQLRRRLSDSAMVAEVGRTITGTLGTEEVFALVVRAAEMLIGGRTAGLALLEEDGTLVLASASGALRPHESATVPDTSPIREPLRTRRPTTSSEPLWEPSGPAPGPAVLVPLESRGSVRGVLVAVRPPSAPHPSGEDLEALRKLGAYAAIAIDNAHLFRQQAEHTTTLRQQADALERAYTELHESHRSLLIAEKMAALGRLTAGIAHEINSPLGSILNCLQLAQTYIDEYRASAQDPDVRPEDHLAIASDLRESLTLAESATRRVAEFVRTIKSQTRPGGEAPRPFDPAEEVEAMALLIRHELRDRRIELRVEADPELLLHGDPARFAVLVQNLVSNAMDAYDGEPGTVRIGLRGLPSCVELSVQDHGVGIPEEIQGRIFDYMFTTKEIGRGTGLGLSTVHGIVCSDFRGTIRFDSAPGRGTTFTILLPLPAAETPAS